jgi:DNA-binding Xre family transcriptional regulator
MQVKITNKIEDKISEYQRKYGSSRTWIANKMGMSTSRMYQLLKADNMNIDVLAKFAIALNCKLDDLIDYEEVEKQLTIEPFE